MRVRQGALLLPIYILWGLKIGVINLVVSTDEMSVDVWFVSLFDPVDQNLSITDVKFDSHAFLVLIFFNTHQEVGIFDTSWWLLKLKQAWICRVFFISSYSSFTCFSITWPWCKPLPLYLCWIDTASSFRRQPSRKWSGKSFIKQELLDLSF